MGGSRSLLSSMSGAFMSGSMFVVGALLVLFPILFAAQIWAPPQWKPMTWIGTQIAQADYAEGQGEIELHAQKRLIDVRMDEVEILNKRLAEIQGQLHADQKWWDTNCGLVSALDTQFGAMCNGLSDQRFDPAFSALASEKQAILNRIRAIEQEVLRIRQG